jgi:hypothetical protein
VFLCLKAPCGPDEYIEPILVGIKQSVLTLTLERALTNGISRAILATTKEDEGGVEGMIGEWWCWENECPS